MNSTIEQFGYLATLPSEKAPWPILSPACPGPPRLPAAVTLFDDHEAVGSGAST